jgi:hypothetical protein
MRRLLLFATAVVIAIGAAAPYLQADFFRPAIARALERGLGRRVEVEHAHFNLFTGPGFTLDQVTIHEDPRAGIEPFAYVESLEARVRLRGLFSRRLEFSNLRLGDATINLVKTDAGPWNFQFLLSGAPATGGAMPAIKMRTGRVNFKFGDTKSVFYFNDADFDVAPYRDGSADLLLSGAPSRTDRTAQNFGHFFVRAKWSGQHLEMRVELERSAIEEVTRLMQHGDWPVHGVVALEAQLSGTPSHLAVAGRLQVDDVHRWDLLPKRGGGWQIGYTGTLDLRGERLELASYSEAPNPPVALKFRASNFLSKPQWDAAAELNRVPLATLLEVARHMGAALPENLAAEGPVSGSVRYSEPEGLAGRVELQDASLTLPDAEPLRAASAALAITREGLSLEPSTIRISEKETAEVQGSYKLGEGGGLDLKIATRGLNVADLQPFGLTAIPVVEHTPQGTWRGSVRYRWSPGGDGEWSGDYELQNARIAVDGLADPVRIQSAAVSLNGKRVSVTRLRAKAGDVAFTGEYRWEPAAVRPHKFKIAIPEADATELERILAPAFVRHRGFLARTLRFGSATVPDWLKARRADGTLSVESLKAGDSELRIESARLLWDGAAVRLMRLNAQVDQAAVNGDLAIDLSGETPHYRFEGRLQDLAYAGGKLDFDGSLDTDGSGVDLLLNARAEGRLRGRSIAFSPEADFRAVNACFEMSAAAGGPRWKLTNLEVQQGADTYYGSGATQTDGRLMIELANRGKQVRYLSSLAAAAVP